MNFNGYEVIDYEVKKHKLRSAKNLRQTGKIIKKNPDLTDKATIKVHVRFKPQKKTE